MERAEYSSTFRGGQTVEKAAKGNLIDTCANVIGTHPDIILRQERLWSLLPEHLKDYVRLATRRFIALEEEKELLPVVIEKIFVEDVMETIDFDNFTGVTNTFLLSVHKRIDLEQLRSLSIVNNRKVNNNTIASFLRGCINLQHLNLKGCLNLKNEAFPEKVVKQLPELRYLNISFTQVSGKAIALVYEHCKKLSTLKLAGCKFADSLTAYKIFPQPSEAMTNLKLRHCVINQNHLQYILGVFPNLETFDYSSSGLRSIRPFYSTSHPSKLRKLNLSNCPSLDLTKPMELRKVLQTHSHLEHIYLTGARISLEFAISDESIRNFKTLFLPELAYPTDLLPVILEKATNLTYLDLSHSYLRFHPDDYAEQLVVDVPNLRTLSLEDTKVVDGSARLISQIHTLHSLFLRGTAISAVGVREIVYACPWLEELDVTSCRAIEIRDRRSLLSNLRKQFWGLLEEAKKHEKVLDPEDGHWYKLERFTSGDEKREGLVKIQYVD